MAGHTPWAGFTDDKLYLQSGQFSATMKTSRAVGAIEASPVGISWDGANTPWSGWSDSKLYLQSGQFSATMKTSRAVGAIDTAVSGIENTTRLTGAVIALMQPFIINTAVRRAATW